VVRTAKDIMSPDPITVGPDTAVTEMAKIMVDNRVRCLPVVDEQEKLLGVVDEEDLVHQDAKIHFPSFIHFLESYIFLPSSLKRFEKELRQAVGATASEVMGEQPHKVKPEDKLEDIATLMVEEDLEYVLVVEGDKLEGVITRTDILKTLTGG